VTVDAGALRWWHGRLARAASSTASGTALTGTVSDQDEYWGRRLKPFSSLQIETC